VRVLIDGAEIYRNKAKYEEAAALGIQTQDNFIRIDRLAIRAAAHRS